MGNSNLSYSSGFGFRILKIAKGSPAAKAKLQPFLDFIINIEDSEDSPVPEENTLNIQNFFQICQANENRPIHITLYNIYSRQLRKIKIMPSKIWSNADSLLGIVIRYEEYITAIEHSIRILSIIPNSLAEKRGLQANDYILGLVLHKYSDLDEFIQKIKKATEQIEACIFNISTQKIRFVDLSVGEGELGCEFGAGIVNQLPQKKYEINLNEEFGINEEGEDNEQSEDIQIVERQEDKNEGEISVLSHDNEVKENNKNEHFVYDKPPKKGEERREEELGSGILTLNSPDKKSIDQMLKQSNSAGILEHINHKRLEHMKKNQNSHHVRVPPKNPFERANLEEESVKKEEEIIEKVEDEKTIEIIEENKKDGEENKESKESEKSDKTTIIDNKEEEGEKENEKKLEEKKEGSEMEEQKRKVVMKYSFYCKRIEKEYVINSNDLFQFDLNLIKNK